ARKYLLAVPGGPEWENLLAKFVTFESLSSSRLPARPRPEEVGWWFKQGRPLELPSQLPIFKSLESFEKEWVRWWTAAQPDWRKTEDWPLPQEVPQEDVDKPDWDELPNGGKDGLFLIIVTLGWW
ncbi:hypothetical protein BJ322DRAFT_990424, partial [Thelephora terrestris]